MPSDQKRDDEVGYRKPPRRTRFRKGQSGNPRGRPSGAKSLSTMLREELNQRVIVVENGRRRKITKRQAIITQLVNRVSGTTPRPRSCASAMARISPTSSPAIAAAS